MTRFIPILCALALAAAIVERPVFSGFVPRLVPFVALAAVVLAVLQWHRLRGAVSAGLVTTAAIDRLGITLFLAALAAAT